MTLTPLEGRISTLRHDARAMVTNGAVFSDVDSLGDRINAALLDGLLRAEWDAAGVPASTTAERAIRAAWLGDAGAALLWLEQCEAHLKSERMARTPQKGGCFGARP